jgi:hypothetical protein
VTAVEHYLEAEEKLRLARQIAQPESGHSDEEACVLVGLALQRAQVHATLALVAAANRAQTEAYGLLRTIIDAREERDDR